MQGNESEFTSRSDADCGTCPISPCHISGASSDLGFATGLQAGRSVVDLLAGPMIGQGFTAPATWLLPAKYWAFLWPGERERHSSNLICAAYLTAKHGADLQS